jgi:hypothetical protein
MEEKDKHIQKALEERRSLEEKDKADQPEARTRR